MTNSSQTDQDEILSTVKNWVNKVIIGLNFCPFAKKEFERDTIRYHVSCSANMNDALGHLLDEVTILEEQVSIQTTLLLFPQGFSDFETFLDLVDCSNILLSQSGYDGIYQLATFHPDYCFEGEDFNDPSNYTNRSPYPILHILRESSIEDVLKRYPNPDNIPLNNIAKARELGVDYIETLTKQYE